MTEQKELSGWRKRFLANRMSFESILFEKELVVRERESLVKGLAGAFAVGLFASILTAQWVLRQGYLFTAADAAGFQMVSAAVEHFRSGGVWNIFVPLSGGFGAAPVPPLYYLTFVPVLKFVTSDLNWAMILVNSFYLTGLTLAVFTAVKKNRNNKSGWLGACFVAALPFVLESARHPVHSLASMALAAAAYAAYINSEEFEYPEWSTLCGIFFGIGFLADTMFWVYMLPLVPFMVSGLSGRLSSWPILRGLLPGAVLALPWYAFASVSWALKYYAGSTAPAVFRPGLWLYLVSLSGAAGLPLFLLGAIALVWMYFSVFMPYSSKKIVAAWFWVPFAAVYFLFAGRTEYMYPALLPLALAVAVMTPGRVRAYLTGLALAFLLVNQSGLVGPFFLGRARVAGLPRPSGGQYMMPKLMAEIKSRTAGRKTAMVALAGADEDESFSHANLAGLSDVTDRTGIKFAAYQPGTLGLADFVAYKTAAFGTIKPGGSNALAREISRPWFSKVFFSTAAFNLSDLSQLVIYAKRPVSGPPIPPGKYPVHKLDLGGIFMEDGSLELSGFDPARGVYARAEFFSPYAMLGDFDIYGLDIEITGFSCFSEAGGVAGIRVTGADTVRIVSARITNYAIERYLTGKYGGLKKIEVKLDKTITISGERKGTPVYWELALSAKPPELELRLKDFAYGDYDMPGFLLEMLRFRYDLSGLPYRLRFSRISMNNQMLEIS
ncbi:MAG: hypothetical protein WCW52_01515 [Elusimicrobiales bacterium]|jgi:hypothetical protein